MGWFYQSLSVVGGTAHDDVSFGRGSPRLRYAIIEAQAIQEEVTGKWGRLTNVTEDSHKTLSEWASVLDTSRQTGLFELYVELQEEEGGYLIVVQFYRLL